MLKVIRITERITNSEIVLKFPSKDNLYDDF